MLPASENRPLYFIRQDGELPPYGYECVARRVYRDKNIELTEHDDLAAAYLAHGKATASHLSAAHVFNLLPKPSEVWLAVPRESRYGNVREGLRLVSDRKDGVGHGRKTLLNGIRVRCTSPERTVLDLIEDSPACGGRLITSADAWAALRAYVARRGPEETLVRLTEHMERSHRPDAARAFVLAGYHAG